MTASLNPARTATSTPAVAVSQPIRLAATLLTATLLCVLAWMLAGMIWALLTPAQRPVAAPTLAGASDWERARALFGDEAAASGQTAAVNTSGIRLRGVYAVDGKTLSAAVVNTGGKRDLTVRIGEEIEKGVTLAAVEADHIEISRGGARERIELDRRIVAQRGGAAGSANIRGFRLNVAKTGPNNYSLSRSELNATLQDPNQLAYTGRIGTGSGGGVRIDSAPTGSLPQKLGLMEGDVIRSLNGQPVNSAGDLARLYGQFGTLSNLRADVMRGGQLMVMNLQITP
ncbi:MAG: type II secretion system protein N [Burkholderiales bacterium]|nr:type II secretion system protein N [Burkholderiales bacterium]